MLMAWRLINCVFLSYIFTLRFSLWLETSMGGRKGGTIVQHDISIDLIDPFLFMKTLFGFLYHAATN